MSAKQCWKDSAVELTPPILLCDFYCFLYLKVTWKVIIKPRMMKWSQGVLESRKAERIFDWWHGTTCYVLGKMCYTELWLYWKINIRFWSQWIVFSFAFCHILLFIFVCVLQVCVHYFSAYPRTISIAFYLMSKIINAISEFFWTWNISHGIVTNVSVPF